LSLGTIVAFTAPVTPVLPLTSLNTVEVEVASALALFDRIFEYLVETGHPRCARRCACTRATCAAKS